MSFSDDSAYHSNDGSGSNEHPHEESELAAQKEQILKQILTPDARIALPRQSYQGQPRQQELRREREYAPGDGDKEDAKRLHLFGVKWSGRPGVTRSRAQ